MAKTLLQLAGAEPKPSRLADSTLVLIDLQNEYFEGPLRLAGVEEAAETAAALLARARTAGTPVIHVRHVGKPGGAFDPGARRGEIHDLLAPREGETVIEKSLPNAFTGAGFEAALEAAGGRPLIIAGFMTHMCVSATARSALDHGLSTTVAADAVATRDLPDPLGGELSADAVNRAALAALADRFATVARAADIPD